MLTVGGGTRLHTTTPENTKHCFLLFRPHLLYSLGSYPGFLSEAEVLKGVVDSYPPSTVTSPVATYIHTSAGVAPIPTERRDTPPAAPPVTTSQVFSAPSKAGLPSRLMTARCVVEYVGGHRHALNSAGGRVAVYQAFYI